MTRPLEELGREVRDALGEGPSEGRRVSQRAAVLDALAEPTRSPRRISYGWLVGGAFGAAAVAAAVLLFVTEPSEALTCSVVGGESVKAGAWLVAPGEESLGLRFSEGSDVVLEPDTRVRLGSVDAKRVRMSVESGALRANIRPSPGLRWTYQVGPYEVIVLGTRLRIGWTPEARRLVVEVEQGRVRVRGGGISQGGVLVTTGNRLEADHERADVRIAPLDAPPRRQGPVPDFGAADAATDEAASDGGVVSDEGLEAERSSERAPGRNPRAARWKVLAERDDYESAIEAAEAHGFNRLVAGLSPWDLMLLGDAYRLGHRGERARAAFMALRERHATHRAARLAAFRLGRVAFDVMHDHAGAARWFETYLRESPDGPLASEARGRLMDSLVRTGNRGRARQVARSYVEAEPQGPYAPLARALLSDR